VSPHTLLSDRRGFGALILLGRERGVRVERRASPSFATIRAAPCPLPRF